MEDRMKNRMLLMLGLVTVFIVAIGLVKFLQIRAAMAGMAFQPPPEAVTTAVARDERWPSILNAIGSVAAVQGVELSADLPGIVASIDFASGDHVHQGDVLV